MSSTTAEQDPRITKRKVTLKQATYGADDTLYEIVATDYVRPDFLDAYVAKARADGWRVRISETPDAGPAGFDGATTIHADLDHPAAGTFYPAADCVDCDHAPAGYRYSYATPDAVDTDVPALSLEG